MLIILGNVTFLDRVGLFSLDEFFPAELAMVVVPVRPGR
jgi:hypothetical protein